MLNEDLDYLGRYVELDKELINRIENHMKRYNLTGTICAYYSDWEDFCSDWCVAPIGYTRTQARALLHNKTGEFMTLPDNKGIIRFSM